MLHIFQHSNKKFDVVSIAFNGNFIFGTNQGFEKKAGAIKTIRSIMKNDFGLNSDAVIFIQDDTTISSGIWEIGIKHKTFRGDKKTHKPYTPNKK